MLDGLWCDEISRVASIRDLKYRDVGIPGVPVKRWL